MKPSMHIEGNVGLFTSAHLADFNVMLCREIKKATNKKVFLFVRGQSSVKKHLKFVSDGWVDDVIDCNEVFGSALKSEVPDDYIETASYYEKKIGVNYNKIFMSKREAGRGFALGGLYHPHSKFSKSVTYEQLLHIQSKTFSFWLNEMKRNDISLFLNGTLEMECVCKHLNITFRTMYAARVDNFYYWATSTKVEPPNLEKTFNSINTTSSIDSGVDQTYFHEAQSRKIFMMGENSILRFLKMSYRAVLNSLYLTVKGYKNDQNYYLFDLIKFYWKYGRAKKFLTSKITKKLIDLDSTRFAYFPLQAEPEFSLQVMSQESFCQIATIASIARDLPAGVKLAVKDSIWAIGRRPGDFYKQILEFHNVVLLNLEEEGVSVIKKCEAVCTISGSGGIEGARMGKPVILFGRHNGYQFLPHVQLVKKEEDLEPAIKQVFDKKIDLDGARVAGKRFTQALRSISFDMKNLTAFQRETAQSEQVNLALNKLITSIKE